MARNPRKKERRRLKRRDKRQQRQRAQAGSPYRRIGIFGEVEACYMNPDWQERGQAVIYCLRSVPGGGHAMASFLVDTWCVGLKDAWGRLDITADEFKHDLVDRMSQQLELVRVDLDQIKRVIAGGIRFARQNGFRLPRKYQRWVSLLGGVGDTEAADLSDFGTEGGRLRYVGPFEDLRERLIGCSPEEFLSREDVQYIVGSGGLTEDEYAVVEEDSMDDDEWAEADDPGDDDFDESDVLEVIAEGCNMLGEKGVNAVKQWCFANGRKPHTCLGEAWELTLLAALQSSPPEDGEPSEDPFETARENLDRLLLLEPSEKRQDLSEAVQQIEEFMAQFDSPQALFESLGINDPPEEE